jgi:hypothetical protein
MNPCLFTCPFCGQETDRADAFFNEGQPFCSDACRADDFSQRRMRYVDPPQSQFGAEPEPQHQLGESDGDIREQVDDLKPLPRFE